jgi:hypothetical protein
MKNGRGANRNRVRMNCIFGSKHSLQTIAAPGATASLGGTAGTLSTGQLSVFLLLFILA